MLFAPVMPVANRLSEQTLVWKFPALHGDPNRNRDSHRPFIVGDHQELCIMANSQEPLKSSDFSSSSGASISSRMQKASAVRKLANRAPWRQRFFTPDNMVIS